MLDWAHCDGCGECAAACRRGAIVAVAVPRAAETGAPVAAKPSPRVAPAVKPAPAAAPAPAAPAAPVAPPRSVEAPATAPVPAPAAVPPSETVREVAPSEEADARRESAPKPRRGRVRMTPGQEELPLEPGTAEATAGSSDAVSAGDTPPRRERAPRPKLQVPRLGRKATKAADADDDAAPTPRAAKPVNSPRAWGWAEMAIVLGVSLVLYFVKDAVLGSRVVHALPVQAGVYARMIVLLAYYVVEIGMLVWLARRRETPFADAFRLRVSFRADEIASAVGVVFVVLLSTRVAALVYGMVGRAFGFRPTAASSDLTTIFGGGRIGLVMAFVLVVIVGPVAEEIAFRGVLLDGLRRRFDPRLAIAVSALLFAAFHFDLWMLVPTTILGLALGWLAVRRRSLWPAIIVHALYNAVAVIAAFYLAVH